MPIWPFSRRDPDPSCPEELRQQLIAAAGTRRLKRLCRDHAEMARANVDVLIQVPADMREQLAENPQLMEGYIQRLGMVAECLRACGVPEVWDALVGTAETNPMLRCDDWLGTVQERMAALEHEALVSEARELIVEFQNLEGSAARQYEAYLRGRIGEALFHSGKVNEAAEAYQNALDFCREIDDQEGVAIYLGNMKEVCRYRGDTKEAISWAEEFAAQSERLGRHADQTAMRKEIARLQAGEPPVRAVCRLPEGTVELEDLEQIEVGVSYKFEFVRNRPGIQKCIELTRRAQGLAADGQLADALAMLDEASDVDPYDPDPIYQSGVALMELGAFDQARERFDEVHRIAPGWFHCRFDGWLAEKLHEEAYPPEVWSILRGLHDSGLEPSQVLSLAREVVDRFDELAIFWLILGDAQRDTGNNDAALESFRKGLQCELEPDVESRLLLSLAITLDVESPERLELLERTVREDGNLFARSVARVMLIQHR